MSFHLPADLPYSSEYHKSVARRWQRSYDEMRGQRDALLEAARVVVSLAHKDASPELIDALLRLNNAVYKAERRA